MRRLFASTVLIHVLVALGPAQHEAGEQVAAPESPKLAVGDPCPPFEVEGFLKGAPIPELEKGQVYVVEFWATWCAPCIEAMPHLSGLQAEYGARGVTVIGTNIRELSRTPEGGYEEVYDEQTRPKVQAFVDKQADRMAYAVAFDGGSRAMDKGWMRAAGREGIPATFVIDRSGTVAWIGHPMVLRMPLDAIVNGTWDWKTGPERVRRAEEAYLDALRWIPEGGVKGLAAWERAAKEFPLLERDLVGRKFDALLEAAQYAAALDAAHLWLDAAAACRDATTLNRIAWTLVAPEADPRMRDLELALRAATLANEFTNASNAGILDTLARVHFLRGELSEAVELQSRAVELATPGTKPSLAVTLAEYQNAMK